ncbi:transposase [Atlantibacter hermannii]
MSGKRYPEEFKIEVVKQAVDRGHLVSSVATRLDITTHSLYAWIKKYGPDSSTNKEQSDAQAGIRRHQKELKRVTDERDILAAYFVKLSMVLVHSDRGSQYTSHEWQLFLKSHGLEGSRSRRGICHDNAVGESFFRLLKRERIKKKIYGTRDEARSDIFDYIEMFYNNKRRLGSSEQMPPAKYENLYYQRFRSV